MEEKGPAPSTHITVRVFFMILIAIGKEAFSPFGSWVHKYIPIIGKPGISIAVSVLLNHTEDSL